MHSALLHALYQIIQSLREYSFRICQFFSVNCKEAGTPSPVLCVHAKQKADASLQKMGTLLMRNATDCNSPALYKRGMCITSVSEIQYAVLAVRAQLLTKF